ncbi:GNAT family N-acetyltransferase [Novosphingobium endophyticum]|nr:GNAT family N-acetyltransferase [Novosphingobium endophyticum]
MAAFHLETDRLILRDWQERDWEPCFALTNTPAVMRWLGGVLDAEGMRRQRERLEAYNAEHGHTFWVLLRKDDGGHLSGELIGFCGLKKANQQGAPIGDFEIGWRLREDAWGRGYAREAAQAALALAFERFSAPHVIALTVEGNEPSWGLMCRLGMKRRRDLDFASDEFDPETGRIIVYSIDRDEWRAIG